MSLLILLAVTPLILALVAFNYLVVIPYLRVYRFKGRKDCDTYFAPIIGTIKLMRQGFSEHDDTMYANKAFSRDHPGKKFVATNMNTKTLFMLHDAQYIKEYLQRHDLYQLGEVGKIAYFLLGPGLLLSTGSKWKKHRKIISSCFHYEFLKSNAGLTQKITREFLAKTTPEELKDYRTIYQIQKITAEVVGRLFFGERLNDYTFRGKLLTTALADLQAELIAYSRSYLAVLFGSKVMHMTFIPKVAELRSKITEFRKICSEIVTDKKKSGVTESGSNLLSVLLRTQESGDDNMTFTDEEIVHEFLTFFAAGMDTTGHLVGMTLYALAKHPQYLEELKSERDRTYNREKNVNSDDLQDMNFLHCVLKETLRMYTPVPILGAKVAKEDHKLVDLDIKKGDLVRPILITPCNDEKYFESPEQFMPNRWRDETKKVDSHAFIPFSAGPRNCIGQHLAIIEAKTIVSELLEKFDFKLQDGYELKMLNRFLYEPADDVKLVLTPKSG